MLFEMREKFMYLPEERNDLIWVVVGSPWGLLALWLAAINLVTFFVFGFDKWKARRKETHESTRRVPEKTLFLLSALGGSVGALKAMGALEAGMTEDELQPLLGMKVFHHKTLHKTFRFGIPAILALQIIVPIGLWVYWNVIR